MRKFHISITPSSSTKGVRFPDDVIKEVEDAIKDTDCYFSAFVVEAVRVALDNLKDDSE